VPYSNYEENNRANVVTTMSPPPQFELSTSTQSDTSFEIASTWLKKCLETHTQCRKSSRTGQKTLPSRLLDVGLSIAAPMLRLCESRYINKPIVYLSTGSLYNQCFVRVLPHLPHLPHSITFPYITNILPMYSTVFYKTLLIIKRMTTTTVAYSKLPINI
jgi:hypothetical protein